MLPIKFQDIQPFVSGEEAKNRFSRWRISWTSNRTFLAIFDVHVQVTLMLPTPGLFCSGEEAKKKKKNLVFKMAAILDF